MVQSFSFFELRLSPDPLLREPPLLELLELPLELPPFLLLSEPELPFPPLLLSFVAMVLWGLVWS